MLRKVFPALLLALALASPAPAQTLDVLSRAQTQTLLNALDDAIAADRAATAADRAAITSALSEQVANAVDHIVGDDAARTAQVGSAGDWLYQTDTGQLFEYAGGAWELRTTLGLLYAQDETAAAARYGHANATLVMGSARGGVFDWTASCTPDDVLTFADAGAGCWVRQWDGTTLRVDWAGPEGDGLADDGPELDAAIAAAVAEGASRVEFGAGKVYRTTTGLVVGADNLYLVGKGATLECDITGGVCLDFNDGSGNVLRGGLDGLAVRREAATGSGSWSDGAIGIRLRSVQWSELKEVEVEGFEYGLQLEGAYGKGVAYNSIELRRIFDNRVNIHLTTDGTTGSYANENKFFGGTVTSSSSRADFSNSYNVRIEYDATAILNNNVFWGVSFESASATTKAFYVDGSYNAFVFCRYETSQSGAFGANSQRNVLLYGRGLRADLIADDGSKNTVMSTFGSRLFGGTLSDEGAYQFQNTASAAYPALSVVSPLGTEVIRLEGDGDVVADGAVVGAGGSLEGNVVEWLSGREVRYGAASPEGSVTALPGSIHTNGNGGPGLLQVKASGVGNTGWAAVQYLHTGTTAARPAASSVPPGWRYWSTDETRPIYSDGSSAWYYADGTAVP